MKHRLHRRDSRHRRHRAGPRGLQLGQAGVRRGPGQCARDDRAHRGCEESRRRYFRRAKLSTTARSAHPSRPSSPKTPFATRVLEECRNQGAHFLSEEEIRKVGELVFRHGHVPDSKIVGKHATVLAELAGIKVPANTRVLIARLEGVGREFPLSAEKLSPILAFYSAPNFAGRHRNLPEDSALRRRRPHRFDSHAERSRRPRVRPESSRIARLREYLRRPRLGRLFHESFPGDDARLRLSGRQHHLRQYRPAAPDESEAHRLGIAPRRAQNNSSGRSG